MKLLDEGNLERFHLTNVNIRSTIFKISTYVNMIEIRQTSICKKAQVKILPVTSKYELQFYTVEQKMSLE
uniref:Uncharacterized protein n=1 Tax=Onchocerca volvulus TaxID=6282 RepID=A0A8R1XQP0_ONCVO